jgi:hypothetical protein
VVVVGKRFWRSGNRPAHFKELLPGFGRIGLHKHHRKCGEARAISLNLSTIQ